MNIYFNIIAPILMSVIWYILYHYLGSYKLTKKESFAFLGILSTINIVIVYFKLGNISVMLSFIMLFIFEYKLCGKIYNAILVSAVYIANITLLDMISGGIVIGVLGFTVEEIRNSILPNSILYIVGIILSILLSRLICILLNYKNLSLKNIKINKILYTYILVTVLVMYLNVTILGTIINHLSIKGITLLIIIFSLYFILSITFAYILHQNHMQTLQIELQSQENERLVGYANLLEKQHDDLRIFKHDYMNILATLGGYIQLRDFDKLDKYFKEKILNSGSLFKEDATLNLIKKIESIPLRGMLYAKLIRAEKAEVQLELKILDNIPLFNSNEVDICKMLGILIDNAIEAAINTEKKNIVITITVQEQHINICISNAFEGAIHNINLLYDKGYSTKGEGRGLGLHTVKALLDHQYKHLKLTTTIKDNEFIQEFKLPIKPFV